MNNGVEMRFPYLSSKLIDFIIKCPLEILIGDGTTKSLFREISKLMFTKIFYFVKNLLLDFQLQGKSILRIQN